MRHLNITWTSLLVTHHDTTNVAQPTNFTTQFHVQHKKMKSILFKPWSILLEDPSLQSCLTKELKVSYHKAQNIKSKIVPSKLKSSPLNGPLILIPQLGVFKCKKPLCLTCNFVQHGQKSFSHKGKTYHMKEFYNFSTDCVDYCLTCPFGLLSYH